MHETMVDVLMVILGLVWVVELDFHGEQKQQMDEYEVDHLIYHREKVKMYTQTGHWDFVLNIHDMN
jgi:hypothetical protein